ncbi:MAG: TonB-dependent receptor [Pseudomonadota bacterium]
MKELSMEELGSKAASHRQIPYALLSLVLFGFGTAAETEKAVLEEVMVTAQLRSESVLDVPISISAVGGERIGQLAITNLQELTTYVPNVNINSGALTPNLFIRGIGSGTNAGFEQSVGMYIDGVYAGRAALSAVPITMDLDRVEVLKGPQSILFGRNAIAGAISVISAKPTDEFEASAEALWAPDHNEQQYNAMVSGPIMDGLSGRLAIRYDTLDGWWSNILNGEEGPDAENFYARGSLRWNALDSVTVDAKYETGDFFTSGNPVVVYQSDFEGQQNFAGTVPIPIVSERDQGASDSPNDRDVETDVFALTVSWDTEFATLTSISAYSGYTRFDQSNTDVAATPSLNRTGDEQFDQYSQELRLVSNTGGNFDWILGGYYQQADLEIRRVNTALDFALSGPLSAPALVAIPGAQATTQLFDQETESWAVFGQGTWSATDTLKFSAGVRYQDESKNLDKINPSNPALGFRAGSNIFLANPFTGELTADVRSHTFLDVNRDDDATTFTLNGQWYPQEDIMLYASISTGFKAGGFDESYSGAGETIRLANPITGEPTGEVVPGFDASVLEYEDEDVLAYEVGAKMKLLGGAAQLNVALFQTEYENLQVSSLVGDVFRVSNAGEATSRGVELDGRIVLSRRWTLAASAAWLDASYDTFDGATCTIPQATDPANNLGCLRPDGSNIAEGETGGQDLAGQTLTFAPEWSANLNLIYRTPISPKLNLLSSVDLNLRDEFYSALDLDPNTIHDAYTLVNMRVALVSAEEKWSVALIGKNLTDEVTYAWRNDTAFTNSNSYFGVAERPLSIAIQGRYLF